MITQLDIYWIIPISKIIMIIAIFIIKKIATDLSKQQALDVDPKAIQQINFTANLNQPQNTMFFIIEEAK